MASMQLQEILFPQGFGTRRACARLVQQDHVAVNSSPCDDPSAECEAVEGLCFTVQGAAWEYHETAYLMLHKPAGYECSQKPSAYPSIYTLLPAPFASVADSPAEGLCRSGDELDGHHSAYEIIKKKMDLLIRCRKKSNSCGPAISNWKNKGATIDPDEPAAAFVERNFLIQ